MVSFIPQLSVVIPTLDSKDSLVQTINTLYDGIISVPGEVIVVDGGSFDNTLAIAETMKLKVVLSEPGRGIQLSQGAQSATGEWLLFLHSDTKLSIGWGKEVMKFIESNSKTKPKAAAFRYKLDDNTVSAKIMEFFVSIRSNLMGLPWGDQGLLISRKHYSQIGGYKNLPIMEDVNIVLRIGFLRIKILPVYAVTSAIRYKQDGYLFRCSQNFLCILGYAAGISPQRLAKFYNRKRKLFFGNS